MHEAKMLDILKGGIGIPQLYWSGYSGVIGLPSVVGPIGKVKGLPVGYQAIAGHGHDFTALAFAEAAERELGGFIPPPLCS